MSQRLDEAVVNVSIPTGVSGVEQIVKCVNDATEEVKCLLLHECDIVIECRVCRNLFRSLPNFIAHKRSYCKTSALVDSDRSASKADLLRLSPNKLDSDQTNDDGKSEGQKTMLEAINGSPTSESSSGDHALSDKSSPRTEADDSLENSQNATTQMQMENITCSNSTIDIDQQKAIVSATMKSYRKSTVNFYSRLAKRIETHTLENPDTRTVLHLHSVPAISKIVPCTLIENGVQKIPVPATSISGLADKVSWKGSIGQNPDKGSVLMVYPEEPGNRGTGCLFGMSLRSFTPATVAKESTPEERDICNRLSSQNIPLNLKELRCLEAECCQKFDSLELLAMHVTYERSKVQTDSTARLCYVCGEQNFQSDVSLCCHLRLCHKELFSAYKDLNVPAHVVSDKENFGSDKECMEVNSEEETSEDSEKATGSGQGSKRKQTPNPNAKSGQNPAQKRKRYDAEETPAVSAPAENPRFRDQEDSCEAFEQAFTLEPTETTFNDCNELLLKDNRSSKALESPSSVYSQELGASSNVFHSPSKLCQSHHYDQGEGPSFAVNILSYGAVINALNPLESRDSQSLANRSSQQHGDLQDKSGPSTDAPSEPRKVVARVSLPTETTTKRIMLPAIPGSGQKQPISMSPPVKVRLPAPPAPTSELMKTFVSRTSKSDASISSPIKQTSPMNNSTTMGTSFRKPFEPTVCPVMKMKNPFASLIRKNTAPEISDKSGEQSSQGSSKMLMNPLQPVKNNPELAAMNRAKAQMALAKLLRQRSEASGGKPVKVNMLPKGSSRLSTLMMNNNGNGAGTSFSGFTNTTTDFKGNNASISSGGSHDKLRSTSAVQSPPNQMRGSFNSILKAKMASERYQKQRMRVARSTTAARTKKGSGAGFKNNKSKRSSESESPPPDLEKQTEETSTTSSGRPRRSVVSRKYNDSEYFVDLPTRGDKKPPKMSLEVSPNPGSGSTRRFSSCSSNSSNSPLINRFGSSSSVNTSTAVTPAKKLVSVEAMRNLLKKLGEEETRLTKPTGPSSTLTSVSGAKTSTTTSSWEKMPPSVARVLETVMDRPNLRCRVCKISTGSSAALRKHCVNHLNVWRFKCKACGFGAYFRSKCELHCMASCPVLKETGVNITIDAVDQYIVQLSEPQFGKTAPFLQKIMESAVAATQAAQNSSRPARSNAGSVDNKGSSSESSQKQHVADFKSSAVLSKNCKKEGSDSEDDTASNRDTAKGDVENGEDSNDEFSGFTPDEVGLGFDEEAVSVDQEDDKDNKAEEVKFEKDQEVKGTETEIPITSTATVASENETTSAD